MVHRVPDVAFVGNDNSISPSPAGVKDSLAEKKTDPQQDCVWGGGGGGGEFGVVLKNLRPTTTLVSGRKHTRTAGLRS